MLAKHIVESESMIVCYMYCLELRAPPLLIIAYCLVTDVSE